MWKISMRNCQNHFEQEEKLEGLAPLDIKMHYKDIVINTMSSKRD